MVLARGLKVRRAQAARSEDGARPSLVAISSWPSDIQRGSGSQFAFPHPIKAKANVGFSSEGNRGRISPLTWAFAVPPRRSATQCWLGCARNYPWQALEQDVWCARQESNLQPSDP
jgi:hypothetical protein